MPYDMNRQLPAYHLVRPPARPDEAPVLDEAQQAVVDHAGQPLLVLAGPGTGKTTAIVETVVDRISRRGVDPERMLVLTFSRKAAEELRERITARLHRTTREPLALTFHSYAYALVRREFAVAGDEPPALLSGPEQLLEVRRLLRGEAEDGGTRWPERLRPALATRGFAAELRDFLLRGAERGLDGPRLARLGRSHRAGRLGGRGRLPGALRGTVRPGSGPRLRLRGDHQDRRVAAVPGGGPGAGAESLRRGAGRRVPGHRPGSGGVAARPGGRRP